MPALALQTGVCSGHACWPPANFAPAQITNVLVNKVQPLSTGDIRIVHCKPCGDNPMCHPGTVAAACATVMGGVGAPAVPLPAFKTGDPETEAILAALAPKVCAVRKPIGGIADSVGCGSVIAVGSPTVLLCNGGSAIAALAAAAAAAGALAGLFTLGFPTIGGAGGPGAQGKQGPNGSSPGDNSETLCSN